MKSTVLQRDTDCPALSTHRELEPPPQWWCCGFEVMFYMPELVEDKISVSENEDEELSALRAAQPL